MSSRLKVLVELGAEVEDASPVTVHWDRLVLLEPTDGEAEVGGGALTCHPRAARLAAELQQDELRSASSDLLERVRRQSKQERGHDCRPRSK